MKPNYKTCPRCCGRGTIRGDNRPRKYTEKQKQEAILLLKKGKTYREVAKILNIKHPGSVYFLVNRTVKNRV